MSSLLHLIRSLLQGVDGVERAEFLASLYSDQCVVVSVFSQLNSLEKAMLFKMLLIDRPLNDSLITHWLNLPRPRSLDRLVALGIVSGDDKTVTLNSVFQATLVETVHAVFPVSSVWTILSDSGPIIKSSLAWHAVLERIISVSPQMVSVKDIDRVTLRLGFGVTPTPPAAYTFVLANTGEQLWTLVTEFVAIVETQRGGGGLAAASIVLKTICGIPRDGLFSSDSLQCLRTIEFLQDLDVVRKQSNGWSLGSTGPSLISNRGSSDTLIGAQFLVDSNMHLTAYTRSNLQVKLVSLFCQVQRVIGKVVVGILTRASVQKAIDAGVSSEGVISFLEQNLHSVQKQLPKNVSLQIKLWEADCPRNRLTIEPVTIFSWRGDRNEQASRAISQLKTLAESHKGLLFAKQEPDGRVYLGVKTDVVKIIKEVAHSNDNSK